MSQADVVTVRAGPAGNGCALRLAGLGHRVVVLESREHIGDKLCTGIVGKACLEWFKHARPTVFRELGAANFVLPSGKMKYIDMERPYAYMIDRVEFVQSLADAAQQAGAEYPANRRVAKIDIDKKRVKVETTTADDKEEVYSGNVLVLASGFGSRFTQSSGLGRISSFTFGAQAEVKTNGVMDAEVYIGRHITPGFFGWLVPTFDGRALVGLMAHKEPRAKLHELISALRSRGKVLEVTKGPSKWGIPLSSLPRTYGERVLAVGDAAGHVKPTTGGGIYYSLICAELAADVIHQALMQEDFSRKQLSSFEELWKARIGKELMLGSYARRLYEVLNDRQIEYLFNIITSNGIHKEII